jgi:hypothetical protein
LEEEDEETTTTPVIPAKGKANVVRPANLICVRCRRKRIRPEKSSAGLWRYPRALECFNCVMVHEVLFNEITRHKPNKKGRNLLFPPNVLDITNNAAIGEFTDKEKIQQAIDRYQEGKLRVDILVVHFPYYYDFTDYFKNTSRRN